MRPLVALLTDFGTRDHYAGAIKGVVLGICPDATLVDITHEIPPHDVLAAALELAACYRAFPAGTVFLVVVDPGVGSARRPLAVEAGEYRFVAPDNGVLTAVLQETPPRRIVELSERRYARPTVSRTFEGRDRFAPAAAWLAKGTEIRSLGRTLTDVVRLDLPSSHVEAGTLSGVVVRVDHFGNLVTNIDRGVFERHVQGAAHVEVSAAGHRIPLVVSTYADAGAGQLCALFGSSEHLEIAVNGGSAAERLGLGRGAVVSVRHDTQGGKRDTV